MAVTTLSSKFQVVIPKDVRERLGLKAGQQLQVFPLPGRIELVPVAAPGSLRGFVSGPNDFERGPDRELLGQQLARTDVNNDDLKNDDLNDG